MESQYPTPTKERATYEDKARLASAAATLYLLQDLLLKNQKSELLLKQLKFIGSFHPTNTDPNVAATKVGFYKKNATNPGQLPSDMFGTLETYILLCMATENQYQPLDASEKTRKDFFEKIRQLGEGSNSHGISNSVSALIVGNAITEASQHPQKMWDRYMSL